MSPDAGLGPAVRGVLGLAALLVCAAGISLYEFPLRTETLFAWTVDHPLTATFLGGSYLAALGLEFTAAGASTWGGARIAMPAVFVFTVLTLVVSVVHREQLHLRPPASPQTRAIAWAWLLIYAGVPLLMIAAALLQRRRPALAAPTGGVRPNPPALRGLLAVLGIVLSTFGLALLLTPEWAGPRWPWPLGPLASRAVGAWLVGLGVAAAHAALLRDALHTRPLGTAGLIFAVLQTVAVVRFPDRLELSGPGASAYLAAVGLIGLAGLWLTVSAWRGPPAAAHAPPPAGSAADPAHPVGQPLSRSGVGG